MKRMAAIGGRLVPIRPAARKPRLRLKTGHHSSRTGRTRRFGEQTGGRGKKHRAGCRQDQRFCQASRTCCQARGRRQAGACRGG